MEENQRSIEGVGSGVEAAMLKCGANVVTEGGLLLRTCEHGIKHPVGRLDDRSLSTSDRRRHEQGHNWAVECCGCVCEQA